MKHYVFNKPIEHKDNCVIFGAGCFWGVERKFWTLDGVTMTSVGYAGGSSINPTYEEVCSGETGHAEVVKISFNDSLKLEDLLKIFWECHDPTQGMRQGNDIGSQYRSVIYTANERDYKSAKSSLDIFQEALTETGYGSITTEIKQLTSYYLAEEYHQQYLAKNLNGYCGIGGTGCAFPNK